MRKVSPRNISRILCVGNVHRLQPSSLTSPSQLTTLQRFASSRLGDEMIYDICSQAASYITERHVDSVRGAQPSLEDQRRKRGEEQAKVSGRDSLLLETALTTSERRQRKKPKLEREHSGSNKKLKKLLACRSSSPKMCDGRRRSGLNGNGGNGSSIVSGRVGRSRWMLVVRRG